MIRIASLVSTIGLLCFPCLADPLFKVELTTATQGFDKEMCWVHARAGAIPGKDAPKVVMTTQKLQLSGSDIFYAIHNLYSNDLGTSRSSPVEQKNFGRVPFSYGEKKDLEMTVCDFWPKWHHKSGTLLGTGHTVVYENNRVMKQRPRATPYAVYNPDKNTWSDWKTLQLPDDPKFENAGAGCVQRTDLENGDILLPIYFKKIDAAQFSVTVLRCRFDGEEMTFLEHGSELSVPIKRGLYEPSIAQYGNRFFLTMRNDDHGYISVSDDGLHFSEPKPWKFDDGKDLGNYNTQQHWVVHSDVLFLVYTRRGAGNDHVFRHRAPLFIARVDPDKLTVIRKSERILIPEKGARLGNFGVTEVSPGETWVTATEWMQAPAPNHHDPTPLIERGADNRIWVAKLKWKKPNKAFSQ